MANTKIEISGFLLLISLVCVLAWREWFVEVIGDISARINQTTAETWFIIALATLILFLLLVILKEKK